METAVAKLKSVDDSLKAVSFLNYNANPTHHLGENGQMSFIIALISAFHPMDCGPVDQGGGILSTNRP